MAPSVRAPHPLRPPSAPQPHKRTPVDVARATLAKLQATRKPTAANHAAVLRLLESAPPLERKPSTGAMGVAVRGLGLFRAMLRGGQ